MGKSGVPSKLDCFIALILLFVARRSKPVAYVADQPIEKNRCG
jgi:hypothetical protein